MSNMSNSLDKTDTKKKNPKDNRDFLEKLGDKIIDADSPQDIVLLTQVRGEVLKQDIEYKRENEKIEEDSKDKNLARFKDKAILIFRIVMSPIALIVGCWLIYYGFSYAGYLALGAGLWLLATELVRGYLLGKKENEQ